MPEGWYALMVRTGREATVRGLLTRRGIQAFLPVFRIETRWSDRRKILERPVFPSYLFARFRADARLPILQVPHVLHILGDARGPVAVPDEQIGTVQRLVETPAVPVVPWMYLHSGDRVLVERGPLAGLEGLVVRTKDACRVVVSVDLMHRSLAAEVDADGLRRLASAPEIPRAA